MCQRREVSEHFRPDPENPSCAALGGYRSFSLAMIGLCCRRSRQIFDHEFLLVSKVPLGLLPPCRLLGIDPQVIIWIHSG